MAIPFHSMAEFFFQEKTLFSSLLFSSKISFFRLNFSFLHELKMANKSPKPTSFCGGQISHNVEGDGLDLGIGFIHFSYIQFRL